MTGAGSDFRAVGGFFGKFCPVLNENLKLLTTNFLGANEGYDK